MPTFDRQDLEDLIEEAISDSLEMDWRPRDGARAVIAALVQDGIIKLTEGPEPGSKEWLMQSPNFHPGDLA